MSPTADAFQHSTWGCGRLGPRSGLKPTIFSPPRQADQPRRVKPRSSGQGEANTAAGVVRMSNTALIEGARCTHSAGAAIGSAGECNLLLVGAGPHARRTYLPHL